MWGKGAGACHTTDGIVGNLTGCRPAGQLLGWEGGAGVSPGEEEAAQTHTNTPDIRDQWNNTGPFRIVTPKIYFFFIVLLKSLVPLSKHKEYKEYS